MQIGTANRFNRWLINNFFYNKCKDDVGMAARLFDRSSSQIHIYRISTTRAARSGERPRFRYSFDIGCVQKKIHVVVG